MGSPAPGRRDTVSLARRAVVNLLGGGFLTMVAVGPWMLKEGPRECDGIWDNHDAARGLEGFPGQLAQAGANNADLDHLAVDVAERSLEAHPVPDADAVRCHHREIPCDRED